MVVCESIANSTISEITRLSKSAVIYLLTPRFKHALCPVPKDCTTSLSHPHWLFGLSAKHHKILFCASGTFKPLTFKSFLTHSS